MDLNFVAIRAASVGFFDRMELKISRQSTIRETICVV